MDAIPVDLQSAALDARDRLATYAQATARAGSTSSAQTQATMAGAAQAAIFADALLGAMRSRIEELRAVAK